LALVLGTHDPRHPVYGEEEGQEAVLVPEWLQPIASGAKVEFGSSWPQRFARSSLPMWDVAPMESTQWRTQLAAAAARDPVEDIRNDRVRQRGQEFFEIQLEHYHWSPLQNLGKVSSQRLTHDTFEQHWVRGIHQNMVFIGHGRQGRVKKHIEKDNYWKKPSKKNSRSGG